MSEREERIVGAPTILISLTARMGYRCQRAARDRGLQVDLQVDLMSGAPGLVEMSMSRQVRQLLSPEIEYPWR